MGPDLARKLDLRTSQRSTAAQSAVPGAEEADQLPYGVHSEAPRLNRITQKVAVKEPIVETHVALRDDASAVPPPRYVFDAVHHEHRGERKASLVFRRRILDEPAVSQSEDLLFRKV